MGCTQDSVTAFWNHPNCGVRGVDLAERNGADKVATLVAEAGFTRITTGLLVHVERFLAETVGEPSPDGEHYVVAALKPTSGHASRRTR